MSTLKAAALALQEEAYTLTVVDAAKEILYQQVLRDLARFSASPTPGDRPLYFTTSFVMRPVPAHLAFIANLTWALYKHGYLDGPTINAALLALISSVDDKTIQTRLPQLLQALALTESYQKGALFIRRLLLSTDSTLQTEMVQLLQRILPPARSNLITMFLLWDVVIVLNHAGYLRGAFNVDPFLVATKHERVRLQVLESSIPPRHRLEFPPTIQHCICGGCRGRTCEAKLKLLRWARWRHTAPSVIEKLVIPDEQETPTPSSIIGDEETQGLKYVESVLPYGLNAARQQGVCSTCEPIQWYVSDTMDFSDAHESVPLYRLREATGFCTFCSFLHRAVAELVKPNDLYCFRSSRYSLFLQAVKCVLSTHVPSESSITATKSSERCVVVSFEPLPFGIDKLVEKSFILHPIALSSTAESRVTGRVVSRTYIHLPLLKNWLRECEATHGMLCHEDHFPNADGRMRFLHLIDVVNYCVVRLQQPVRYIALTYVWGHAVSLQLTRENEARLGVPSALQEHLSELPQTFLDAFEVVRGMGERYIWIDALCIVQDAEDRQAHIQDMHFVYGAALATIVAGHGVDANAGLPGIKTPRSVHQIFEETQPGTGVAVSLPLPRSLSSSKWSARAWTYQEQLLSRRFLIFHDGQVIWQCPTTTQCEDTSVENKTFRYQPLQNLFRSNWLQRESNKEKLLLGYRRPLSFQRYADAVTEYLGRELTFSKDILLAFGGLSKLLGSSMKSEMVSGLPVSFFDAALLWQPRHPLRKRRGSTSFASWSWAAWEGKVVYDNTSSRDNVEAVLPLIQWVIYGSELLSGSEIEAKPFNHDSRVGRISDDAIMAGRASLHFWTSCSFFEGLLKRKAPDGHPFTDFNASNSDLECQEPEQFLIQTGRGRPVGMMVSTGAEPLALNPLWHEYIVLSEAQFYGVDPVSWKTTFSEEPGWNLMYNVMLVEWNEFGTRAYRVGLGRIMKYAWKQSKPQNKYITLG